MRGLVLGLSLALLAACADEPATPTTPGSGAGAAPGSSTVGTAPASPLPSVTSPVTADNLSGKWIFGSRNEPPAGPVAACSQDQVMSILDQGGTVAGAIALCGSSGCDKEENFSGSNNNGQVVLQGAFIGNMGSDTTAVDYTLTFNPKTQHLVGTRSGQPFWAAPWVVPRSGCAASPTPAASIGPTGGAGGTEQ